jgi:hypothetical protein
MQIHKDLLEEAIRRTEGAVEPRWSYVYDRDQYRTCFAVTSNLAGYTTFVFALWDVVNEANAMIWSYGNAIDVEETTKNVAMHLLSDRTIFYFPELSVTE